ncbi:MAG: hypothetical protein ACJ71D_10710 [Nitrososphaera sp.]
MIDTGNNNDFTFMKNMEEDPLVTVYAFSATLRSVRDEQASYPWMIKTA